MDTGAESQADRDERLKIYLMYVDSAQQITARRHEANRYYLSAIAAVSVTYSYAYTHMKEAAVLHLVIALAAAALCLVWRATLTRFKRLNGDKFRVIAEIEQALTIKPFTREQALQDAGPRGWGPTSFASTESILASGAFLASMFLVFIHGFQLAGF
jgi:divalent metal cation (Fe/Co/Zn/Cd) transporter